MGKKSEGKKEAKKEKEEGKKEGKKEKEETKKPAASVDLAAFQAAGLKAHNEFRKRHGVEPLVSSPALNAQAQKWAEAMAEKKKLEHSPQPEKTGRVGENIYWGSAFCGNEEDAKAAVASWYDEVAHYNFAKHGTSRTAGKMIGHFTEVVWRRCYELGMGVSVTKKGEVYVVANYDPPGNLEGNFEDNVFPVGATPPPRPLEEDIPNLVCKRHNQIRARHGTPLICVNTALNNTAAEIATTMANTQDFRYLVDYKYGLNIEIVSEFNPVAAVDTWYRQGDSLGPTAALTSTVANFAQVMWKETKRIGVALAVGRPFSVIVVIYEPKGDNPATFRSNVSPPLSENASTPLPPLPVSVPAPKTNA